MRTSGAKRSPAEERGEDDNSADSANAHEIDGDPSGHGDAPDYAGRGRQPPLPRTGAKRRRAARDNLLNIELPSNQLHVVYLRTVTRTRCAMPSWRMTSA